VKGNSEAAFAVCEFFHEVRFSSEVRASIMMAIPPAMIELNMDQQEQFLQRIETAVSPEDYQLIQALSESYVYLAGLVGTKNMTIHRLHQMLFGPSTETTAKVTVRIKKSETPDLSSEPPPLVLPEASPETPLARDSKIPPPGHGRKGADAYTGAEKIEMPH
jgi:hypothetical protein